MGQSAFLTYIQSGRRIEISGAHNDFTNHTTTSSMVPVNLVFDLSINAPSLLKMYNCAPTQGGFLIYRVGQQFSE